MFSSTEWCLPWVDNVQFQSRETQMERRHCSRYDLKIQGNIHQLMEEFCVLFRKVGLTGRRELAVLRNLQQLAVNCLKSLFCLTPCNRSRGILHCSGQLWLGWWPGMRDLRPAGVPGQHSHSQRGGQVGAAAVFTSPPSVFRCWSCTKGWFDLGGPAWRALTGGAPPGHVHGVKSTWVTCPGELARGNIRVYVKPGSDPWDARFQVIGIK